MNMEIYMNEKSKVVLRDICQCKINEFLGKYYTFEYKIRRLYVILIYYGSTNRIFCRAIDLRFHLWYCYFNKCCRIDSPLEYG